MFDRNSIVEPAACAKCGLPDADHSCMVRGMRYEKTTGLFAKQHHYTVTDVETPLCSSCATGLATILVVQRVIIIIGGLLTGSLVTYELQQYTDPTQQFQWTCPCLQDMAIPVSIVSAFCAALLMVATHWLFQWPWLQFTGVNDWLVQSGCTTSGVKITRMPRRSKRA
jgi:hypothetical protein